MFICKCNYNVETSHGIPSLNDINNNKINKNRSISEYIDWYKI